jgi:hypothetical protein
MPPRARPDLGSHKRARVDISAVGGASQCDLPSPIDTRFFTSKSMAACKRDFQTAKPFPHLRLTKFCDEDRMRAIREEITGRLHSKFKETDLYKVCGSLLPCVVRTHQSDIVSTTGESNRRPHRHRRSPSAAAARTATAAQSEVPQRAK